MTQTPLEQHLIPFHTVDPTGCRVLVVAPHPDDETFGCGGTLAHHVLAGDTVQVAVLTDGSRGDFSRRYDPATYVSLRREETRSACACLGIGDVVFWPLEDRRLAEMPEASGQMGALIDQFQPKRIYAPSVFEFHPDHRAAAHLVVDAVCRPNLDLEVAFYEINQPLCVNMLVDITGVLRRKKSAIAAYQSQLAERSYGEFCLALNRFRAQTLPREVTHAEGFSVWPSALIRSWHRKVGPMPSGLPEKKGHRGIWERMLPFWDTWYDVADVKQDNGGHLARWVQRLRKSR